MDGTESHRTFFFGTNLKMHQTASETVAFLDGLVRSVALDDPRVQYFVLPPFTSLAAVTHHPARPALWIGAQNMHWAASGAFTGEISAPMLREFDLDLVMLGHAERRRHFGETDATVHRKIRAAFDHGLRALLCVGESAIDHTEGRGIERVRSQLRTALDGISPHEASALLVAYEPVWAIGEAGVPAEPEEVAMVVDAMRGELDARFEPDARPPVLYGGSVDRTNCAAFAAIPAIDGLFVGRAAWTVSGFAETAVRARAARFGGVDEQE